MITQRCIDADERQRNLIRNKRRIMATYPTPGKPRWYDDTALPEGVVLDAHGTPRLEDAWVLGTLEAEDIDLAVAFVHDAARRYHARFAKFAQVQDLIHQANAVSDSINR